MSLKESSRVSTIQSLIEGRILVREAATALDLSERQIIRLKKGVQQQGTGFLAHKNRGRKPPNLLPEATRHLALELATTELSGASCQHMSELLAQHHSVKMSAKSLLRLLKSAGIANPHSHKAPRRRRCRRRMPQRGMLVQTDATPLAWFENRGPAATLHGFIDDATSEVLSLHFRPTEDSTGYMTAMRFMLEHNGCPVSLYADRHAIFRVNQGNPLSIEEQLEGRIVPVSQFGRALQELGIRIIYARSPQAKGRVERLWRTLHHRLLVEMRIARICDPDQANAFLPGFVKRYNQRFAALPLDPNSAFRPAPASEQLDQILAFKEKRTANNGSVISFEGLLYQLVEASGRVAPLPARSRIDVVRSLDGSLFAIHDQKRYSLTRLVPALPEKPAAPKPVSTEQHKPKNAKRGKPFRFIKKPRVLLPNHAGRAWLYKS